MASFDVKRKFSLLHYKYIHIGLFLLLQLFKKRIAEIHWSRVRKSEVLTFFILLFVLLHELLIRSTMWSVSLLNLQIISNDAFLTFDTL
jgi:hypothetical protein